MRNCLLISHGFNMDGRAASLTVSDKIPFLLERGINPVVLSAITGNKDLRFLHFQLLPWGPSGLRFDFRHWISKKYGRGAFYQIATILVSLVLLPFIAIEKLISGLSSQASWANAAAYKGKKLVKDGQIDFIYSSGGAWSAHYAAYLIKKTTGITWIAEIHDPMVIREDPSDDGVRPRKTKDKRFVQYLEKLICSDADHVWWFTQGALDFAKRRHPELGDKGFIVFPGALPPGCQDPPPFFQYSEKLHIAHFGSLANDRSLAPVLEALDKLFKEFPSAKELIVLDVYGAGLDYTSKVKLDKLRLSENVMLHGRIENDPTTEKSGRKRIMEIMRSSDVLLMLHGDYEWCAEYIPSKMYDYFWAYRPIWGITNRNPELDQILIDRKSYLSHTLDPDSIFETLKQIYQNWENQSLPIPQFNPISPKDAVETILQRLHK
jgi:glycosyltransferase involved in cell wall biosynthesis